jgi:hypothetical protein
MHLDFVDTIANNEDPLGVHGDLFEPILDPVPDFYTDNDTIRPNFLEGAPVIVTRDGEIRYQENTQDDETAWVNAGAATPWSGSPPHSVTLPYPDAGSRFYYLPTLHDVKAIEEHDRLRERGNAPE